LVYTQPPSHKTVNIMAVLKNVVFKYFIALRFIKPKNTEIIVKQGYNKISLLHIPDKFLYLKSISS